MATTTAGGNEQKTVLDDKSSPTSSGPDSEVASIIEELPQEDEKQAGTGDLGNKVSAGANYLGSMFSSAWSKTAKTANNASAATSFLSTAFNKVGVGPESAAAPEPEKEAKSERTEEEANNEDGKKSEEHISNSASAFFSSAWTKVGGTFTRSASATIKNSDEAPAAVEEQQQQRRQNDGQPEDGKNFFTNISSMVGKVAQGATTVIKDKVSVSMISEFNKEQEEFIRSKGNDLEVGLAPWIGYQEEEAMKAKILSLSQDKRNFVRAPPAGVSFEFDYASVSAIAMALLQEDPQLDKMRYELVPKQVKEDEFWRNYFYRVNLIKQSFDLKDLESGSSSSKAANKATKRTENDRLPSMNNDEDGFNATNPDHDDEFVSESYQASSEDIDEANASMKKLGVKGSENEEWEAELEGELNEFEMVSSKDGNEENDPEWENQIQQMLDAEEQKDTT